MRIIVLLATYAIANAWIVEAIAKPLDLG